MRKTFVAAARCARLKIHGHVEKLALDACLSLTDRVTDKDYGAKSERMFRLRLDAFDWNCPQHITPRFTEREIAAALQPLRECVAELEQENASLQRQLNTSGET